MGFKIGDNIVYAGSGVCQIDDIKDELADHEARLRVLEK